MALRSVCFCDTCVFRRVSEGAGLYALEVCFEVCRESTLGRGGGDPKEDTIIWFAKLSLYLFSCTRKPSTW